MTIRMIDLRVEAAAEALRLTRARAMIRDGDERALDRLEGDAVWIAMPRRSRSRRTLGRRVCLIWRAAFEDAAGRVVESRLVAVQVEVDPARRHRERIRSLLPHIDDPIRARVEAECEPWRKDAARVEDAFTAARLSRERDIASPRVAAGGAAQAGLFDRRSERAQRVRTAAAADAEHAARERLRAAATGAAIAPVPARLLLVLVP